GGHPCRGRRHSRRGRRELQYGDSLDGAGGRSSQYRTSSGHLGRCRWHGRFLRENVRSERAATNLRRSAGEPGWVGEVLMATEIRLASRPSGMPTLDDFTIAEVDTPTAGTGRVVVRNVVLSVDPYMRGRMNNTKSYVAPFEVGEVMDGGAVGEVIE